ncbi:MAG TPA: hypothetical protein VGY13_07305 [Solirubrobacteraceae bacterium]|jgi:hypothetical protein|nr:hypothetical protein [Solirubrobacteraceae bacterium]
MTSFTTRQARGFTALALAVLAVACTPGASVAAGGSSGSGEEKPVVTTGPAHALGSLTELTGTINTHGVQTSWHFDYGPTSAYGSASKTEEIKSGATAVTHVTALVSGVPQGDNYRLVATPAGGAPVEGKNRVFTVKVKSTKSKIELPKTFQPTIVGGTFVLSGTLTGTGNANRAVVLQASPYPYRTAYANVQEVHTSTLGGFSFTVRDLTASTRYRVATVATPTAPPLFSEILTQLVEVRVTLHAQTSRHAKGIVRLFGTVSPAEVGAHVFVQLEQTPKAKQPRSEKLEKTPREEVERAPRFATRFSTVVKRATKTISRFSIVVNVKDSGNYRAFVAVPAGPLASGESETVALRAAPKKKKRH